MKLFLVGPTKFDYDQYDSFVVRAEDEAKARSIASKAADKYAPSNAKEFMLKSCKCVEITTDGEPGVILGSFNAG